MAKLVTDPVGSFSQAAITTLNTNFDRVEAALENTLSRDGTSPNQMGADLDLNHNDIINIDNLAAAYIDADRVDVDSLYVGGDLVTPDSLIVADADKVQGVTPGAAGLIVLAKETEAEIRTFLGVGATFATRAEAEAFNPETDPTSIVLFGNLLPGDMSFVCMNKVASEPTHEGKLKNANGTWYELASNDVDWNFFKLASDLTDDALAINRAFEYVTDRGGGNIHATLNATALGTLPDISVESPLVVTAPGKTIGMFCHGRKMKLGSEFLLGGTYDATSATPGFFRPSGGSSITLTSTSNSGAIAQTLVSTATSSIPIPSNVQKYFRKSGLKVQVSSSGTLPTGLVAATNYWTIWDDTNGLLSFASSIANSESGTKVPITAQGSGSITITRQNMLSSMHGNYAVFDGSLQDLGTKGTRFNISNRSTSFAVRPTTLASVEYIDTEKRIINFYPAITFDTTITVAGTGEIDKTDIGIEIYPDDINLTVDRLWVEADFLPVGAEPTPVTLGQMAGAASAIGIVATGGVFHINNARSVGIQTFFRGQECTAFIHDCEDAGSGDGIASKVDSGSLIFVSSSKARASRHGVDIGSGSNLVDGSAGMVVNSLLASSRQAFNEKLRPGTEAGAFRMHPNAVWGLVDNCEIYGGLGLSNGYTKVSNSRIYGAQTNGFCELDASGNDKGIVEIDNSVIFVPHYIDANDESNGAGAFGSSSNLMKDISIKEDFATSAVDITNDVITVADTTSTGFYPTAQKVYLNVGGAGALPAGLSPRTLYYVRRVSSTTVSFHPTSADATANTNKINLTDVGTGTNTISYAYPKDWRMVISNSRIECLDGKSWPASSDLSFLVGPQLFKGFELNNVKINLTDTNFRRMLLAVKGTGTGDLVLKNVNINGGGLVLNSDAYRDDWRRLLLDDVDILNTDATFITIGLSIGGDASATSPTELVRRRNINIESLGTSSLCTMTGFATQSVVTENVHARFTAASGTCASGIVTDSNANVRAENFEYIYTGNFVKGRSGVNTITLGHSIVGGGAVGGVTAQVLEKNNYASSCTTNLSLTGSRMKQLTETFGSTTYDPASIANGAQVTTTVTCTGAALGDRAEASFSLSLAGVTLTAYVSAADTVTCIFSNTSGSAVDLSSGTLAVRTSKINGG